MRKIFTAVFWPFSEKLAMCFVIFYWDFSMALVIGFDFKRFLGCRTIAIFDSSCGFVYVSIYIAIFSFHRVRTTPLIQSTLPAFQIIFKVGPWF